ncbi:MAG TPA: hypothetical protein VHT68_11185 [Pseudolabrys sp.]|jgi:hypothetical protein|nr:hypothetical protein [Pseudolabrys sp.]
MSNDIFQRGVHAITGIHKEKRNTEIRRELTVAGKKNMIDLMDQFRKHADRCRLHAEMSSKPADRAFWLLLAQNWQLLAQDMEAEPPEDRQEVEAKLAG